MSGVRSTISQKGVMKYPTILLLIVAGSVNAASFNCDKAATLVEKAICSNNNLGKLDDVLSENYTAMMASDIGDGARKDLIATQRDWLTTRNKCTTVQCVEILYRQRIDTVCEYPVISGIHPICVNSDEALPSSGAPHQNQQMQQQLNPLSQGQATVQPVQQEELRKNQLTSDGVDEPGSEEAAFKAWQASQAKKPDTPIETPKPQSEIKPAKAQKSDVPSDDLGFFTLLFTALIGLPLAYPIWKIIVWMDQYMISRAERYHRPAAQIILPQIGGSLAIGLFIGFVIVTGIKISWRSLFN